jgi:nitroreductase
MMVNASFVGRLGEMMDAFEAISGRRSVRSFGADTVSDDDVDRLLDAARWAPSAGNVQPWEFVVVKKPEAKSALSEAAFSQMFIESAPLVIVVCADERRSSRTYGARGKNLYCIQDTAAAVQNILLAAYSMGLGACWVGAFEEKKVVRVLKAPDGVRPVALVPVGHPAGASGTRSRRSASEVVHEEVF